MGGIALMILTSVPAPISLGTLLHSCVHSNPLRTLRNDNMSMLLPCWANSFLAMNAQTSLRMLRPHCARSDLTVHALASLRMLWGIIKEHSPPPVFGRIRYPLKIKDLFCFLKIRNKKRKPDNFKGFQDKGWGSRAANFYLSWRDKYERFSFLQEIIIFFLSEKHSCRKSRHFQFGTWRSLDTLHSSAHQFGPFFCRILSVLTVACFLNIELLNPWKRYVVGSI